MGYDAGYDWDQEPMVSEVPAESASAGSQLVPRAPDVPSVDKKKVAKIVATDLLQAAEVLAGLPVSPITLFVGLFSLAMNKERGWIETQRFWILGIPKTPKLLWDVVSYPVRAYVDSVKRRLDR